MPHTPRRMSSTVGVPPELTSPPRAEHAPIPLPEKKEPRKKLGIETISLATYEPDFDKMFKSLFGHEPEIDTDTGYMVHKL